MRTRRLWLGMAALRAMAAFAMIAVLGSAAARGVAAAPAAQVDGDTFEAQTYDWSVTWDDDVWEVSGELNDDGYDGVALQSSDPLGFATIEGFEGYDGDPADCVDDYERVISNRDDVSDVELDDRLDTPRAERGAESAVYIFVWDLTDGPIDVAEYVECRSLAEDEAVLRVSYQTAAQLWEDALPIFEDLHDGIEAEAIQGGDDDDAGGGDEDDTEEDPTPTPEPAPTRDVIIDEDDDAGGAADSGIDDNEYESPTYGYTLDWDDDVWEADPDGELVEFSNNTYDELDRLVLRSVDEFGTLYIEGFVNYDGDVDDCLEGEAELLADEDGIEEFELALDDDDEELTGESDAGGAFGVYTVVYVDPEDEDEEEFEFIDYIECRELIEDEAVLVLTFVTDDPDDFDDNFELVLEVLDTIELADVDEDIDEDEEDVDEEDEDVDEEEEDVDEEDEDDAGDDTAGIDGNVYESPSYGHTIEWDEDVWEAEDATSRRGVDTLVLSSEFGIFILSAADEFDGDAADCFDALEEDADDTFDDLEIVEGEDGPARQSEDGNELGFYTAEMDGDPAIIFLQCIGESFDDVTISVTFVILSDDIDDALDAMQDLVETLTDPV